MTTASPRRPSRHRPSPRRRGDARSTRHRRGCRGSALGAARPRACRPPASGSCCNRNGRSRPLRLLATRRPTRRCLPLGHHPGIRRGRETALASTAAGRRGSRRGNRRARSENAAALPAVCRRAAAPRDRSASESRRRGTDTPSSAPCGRGAPGETRRRQKFRDRDESARRCRAGSAPARNPRPGPAARRGDSSAATACGRARPRHRADRRAR